MYETKTLHFFTTRVGERWQAQRIEPDVVVVEETRKNGQEDCHQYVTLERVDGLWCVTEGRTATELYGYGPEPLEAFLNEHGPPGGDEQAQRQGQHPVAEA